MEILRITRQIHCKAVELRATLIHRQYNRAWGTSYSRPHRDPYLTPPPLLQNPGGATVKQYATRTPPPAGKRSVAISSSVCVSVCVCVCVHEHIYVITRPIFTQFFLRVTYDHGSVLLRQRCDMSCIWVFLSDVMFADYYDQ